eukprot:365347-Chlamydomonas_euryale.AAC.26
MHFILLSVVGAVAGPIGKPCERAQRTWAATQPAHMQRTLPPSSSCTRPLASASSTLPGQ